MSDIRWGRLWPLLLLPLLAGCGHAADPGPLSAVAANAPAPTPTPLPTLPPAISQRVTCPKGAVATEPHTVAWVTGIRAVLTSTQEVQGEIATATETARGGNSSGATTAFAAARDDLQNATAALAVLRAPTSGMSVQSDLHAALAGYDRAIRDGLRSASSSNDALLSGAIARAARSDGEVQAAQYALAENDLAAADTLPGLAHCTSHRLQQISVHATATVVARQQARIRAAQTAIARLARTEIAQVARLLPQSTPVPARTAVRQARVRPAHRPVRPIPTIAVPRVRVVPPPSRPTAARPACPCLLPYARETRAEVTDRFLRVSVALSIAASYVEADNGPVTSSLVDVARANLAAMSPSLRASAPRPLRGARRLLLRARAWYYAAARHLRLAAIDLAGSDTAAATGQVHMARADLHDAGSAMHSGLEILFGGRLTIYS